MSDENTHATKEDLRYVEGRLEGKIDSLGKEIKHLGGSIDEKFADKGMVGELHRKYWDMNKQVNLNTTGQAVILNTLKTWGTVIAFIATVVSPIITAFIVKYLQV